MSCPSGAVERRLVDDADAEPTGHERRRAALHAPDDGDRQAEEQHRRSDELASVRPGHRRDEDDDGREHGGQIHYDRRHPVDRDAEQRRPLAFLADARTAIRCR